MKKNLTQLLLGIILFACSCNKEIEFIPLNTQAIEESTEKYEPFEVKLLNEQYTVGEPVKFYFTGNTESIDFYSGEKYHQYEFKDGRIGDYLNPILTWQTYNNNNPREVNNFVLMVSNDLVPTGGTPTAPKPVLNDIKAATWTNLSSKMIYPTTSIYVPQGENNLSAYTEDDKPLYIAFKYTVSYSQATTPAFLAYTWYVRDFKLVNRLPDASNLILALHDSSLFTAVNENPSFPATWGITVADRFTIVGNKNAPNGTATWIVSNAFYASKNIDLGPDLPINIKSPQSSKLLSYSQIYTKAGNYKAHFVVKQKNKEGVIESFLKTVDVTVNP
jgi:hypothetical protein